MNKVQPEELQKAYKLLHHAFETASAVDREKCFQSAKEEIEKAGGISAVIVDDSELAGLYLDVQNILSDSLKDQNIMYMLRMVNWEDGEELKMETVKTVREAYQTQGGVSKSELRLQKKGINDNSAIVALESESERTLTRNLNPTIESLKQCLQSQAQQGKEREKELESQVQLWKTKYDDAKCHLVEYRKLYHGKTHGDDGYDYEYDSASSLDCYNFHSDSGSPPKRARKSSPSEESTKTESKC